jgi:hypothetical protein
MNGKKQKTYRRFSGMFFLESPGRRFWLGGNGLQQKKSRQSEKTRK